MLYGGGGVQRDGGGVQRVFPFFLSKPSRKRSDEMNAVIANWKSIKNAVTANWKSIERVATIIVVLLILSVVVVPVLIRGNQTSQSAKGVDVAAWRKNWAEYERQKAEYEAAQQRKGIEAAEVVCETIKELNKLPILHQKASCKVDTKERHVLMQLHWVQTPSLSSDDKYRHCKTMALYNRDNKLSDWRVVFYNSYGDYLTSCAF
jgi:hypothetical protein